MSEAEKARVVAIAAIVLVAAYATLAALQILVLNPLAAVPGLSLPQINADLAARDESLGASRVVAEAVVAVGLAVILGVVALRARWPLSRLIEWFLIMLVLGAPAYFVANFGAGMSLADTYGIAGGDASPWALPLYLVSGLALLALLGTTVASSVRGRRGLNQQGARR